MKAVKVVGKMLTFLTGDSVLLALPLSFWQSSALPPTAWVLSYSLWFSLLFECFSHRAVSCSLFSRPQLPAQELLPALCKINDLSLRLPSAPVDTDNNVHVRWSRDSLVRRHWKRGSSPSLNAQTRRGHNQSLHWGGVSLSHFLVTASFKCLNTLFTSSLPWGRIRSTRSDEQAVVTATAGSGPPELKTHEHELEFGLVSSCVSSPNSCVSKRIFTSRLATLVSGTTRRW